MPYFRDACVRPIDGSLVFFYKRVQILVADVWSAFGRAGISGVEDLTTFPDYRVPQLLRMLGVLEYGEGLARAIDGGEEICAGSEEEVEIRAATVVAVERLKEEIREMGREMSSVEIDWYLWERGEKLELEGGCGKHHKTRTIFY